MVIKRGRDPLAWGLLAVGGLALGGYLLLPGGADVAQSVGYLVVAAVGVAMAVLGAARVGGSRRRVWVAVAAAQVLYLLGDVLWVVFELVLHVAPYPSAADAAYLLRYPVLATGLAWLVRGRRSGRDRAALLDAAIISTGFAVLGGVFVVLPAAAGGGESLLSQLVAAAYPVGDLLVLAVMVRLLTSGAARSVSYRALLAGLVALLVVDVPSRSAW